MKYIDIKNEKFNRLTAIEYLQTPKGKSSIWLCKCDCGNLIKVDISSLRNKNTQSCGCLGKEKRLVSVLKHNRSKTSEYYVWSNMIQRCSNTKNSEYKNYGARGILVCEEWKDFINFFNDMGEKPQKDYSLDRINNEKGYSKENCRWTDSFTQSSNRRYKENELKIRNISYSERDSLYCVDIIRKSIRYRKSFKKLEDAISFKKETLEIIE